jgi:hypothetical protein
MSTAAPTSEELRESKKAEAELLAVRLHRQLAKLEPEKYLWRVEFDTSTSAWSTAMLRSAWNPDNKALLHQDIYTAVLAICEAPDSVRKTFWSLFRQAEQITKSTQVPGKQAGHPPARRSGKATQRALAVVDDERGFLRNLEVMRQRAGLSTRALRQELIRRKVLVPAQSTFDNWFKAGRLPPQLNERLLSVIVTILEERICGEADVDYGRVEEFVNRFRLLIERRVADDSEDRLAKRLLAHVAARRNEITRLHGGAASPMLDALLGELAATERVILAGIAGDETLQKGERATVA